MNSFMKIMAALILTAVAMTGLTGCKKDKGTDAPESHEYVDLSLPSGTLWATCNVGADNPENVGYYFSWGEVSPKDTYTWDNYRYGDCIDEQFEMTKYCPADSIIILEPMDDAATVNWGSDWRMATKEEWEELYLKTTWTWTERNGVQGRLLTGINGNSIFLPAAGFCLDNDTIGISIGMYWTSSLQTIFPERGWSYHFDDVNSHVCGTYQRCRGQSVRAVKINPGK